MSYLSLTCLTCLNFNLNNFVREEPHVQTGHILDIIQAVVEVAPSMEQ